MDDELLPATVGQMRAINSTCLYVRCRACGHDMLIDIYGHKDDEPLCDWARRFVCRPCGSRDIAWTPSMHNVGATPTDRALGRMYIGHEWTAPRAADVPKPKHRRRRR